MHRRLAPCHGSPCPPLRTCSLPESAVCAFLRAPSARDGNGNRRQMYSDRVHRRSTPCHGSPCPQIPIPGIWACYPASVARSVYGNINSHCPYVDGRRNRIPSPVLGEHQRDQGCDWSLASVRETKTLRKLISTVSAKNGELLQVRPGASNLLRMEDEQNNRWRPSHNGPPQRRSRRDSKAC
jgi:hypothetical protein